MPVPQLFLSYNSADRQAVATVQKLLQAGGITTFLDRGQLVAGLPWPQALEQGLRDVKAVAVFIGRELGVWQKRERWFALDLQAREEKQRRPFPVIPVLLPGADLTPGFVFSNTWIDLRSGLDAVISAEGLDAFERTMRSTRANAVPEASAVRAPEGAITVCPYRGLEVFREEDAAFFAGRTASSDQLLELTREKDLVAVVGPSGSGKSSVVQAEIADPERPQRLRFERGLEPRWEAVGHRERRCNSAGLRHEYPRPDGACPRARLFAPVRGRL